MILVEILLMLFADSTPGSGINRPQIRIRRGRMYPKLTGIKVFFDFWNTLCAPLPSCRNELCSHPPARFHTSRAKRTEKCFVLQYVLSRCQIIKTYVSELERDLQAIDKHRDEAHASWSIGDCNRGLVLHQQLPRNLITSKEREKKRGRERERERKRETEGETKQKCESEKIVTCREQARRGKKFEKKGCVRTR